MSFWSKLLEQLRLWWLQSHRITFDAKSAGTSVHALDGVSTAWSHTVSRGCTLVVGIRWIQTQPAGNPQGNPTPPRGSPTRSVAWNGKPMDNWFGPMGIDNAEITDPHAMFLEFFGLISPQDGPGTITVTVARPGAEIFLEGGCSLSYARVRQWGVWTGMFDKALGTYMAQEVTSRPSERVLKPNDMVVHMFTSGARIDTDHYSQTLRHEGNGFVVGDAPGAKTVSFRASSGDSGAYYAGLAMRLLY